MCDSSTSPRSSVWAESSPELLPREPAPDRDSRRKKPACLELLTSPSHVSQATTASTHDTATSPSPRRKSSGFVWADASPGDWDEADLLPEAWWRDSVSEEAEATSDQTARGCGCRSRASSPARAGAEEAVPATRWQPNARAPEFIPTTSMECVLVGVAAACPQGRTGFVGLGVAPADEVAKLVGKACSAGPQCEAPAADTAVNVASTPGAAPASSRRRKPGMGKCRPAPLVTAPADLDDTPAEAAEAGPDSCAAEAAEEAKEKPDDCVKGVHVMPEATEEEWQHRADMRSRAIEVGKDTKEYRIYCDTKKDGPAGCEEPRTPDAHDRTISKRTWKFLLRQWRVELQRRCLEEDNQGSVVSTEDQECLSVGRSPAEDPEGPSTIGGDSDSEFFPSEI